MSLTWSPLTRQIAHPTTVAKLRPGWPAWVWVLIIGGAGLLVLGGIYYMVR